METVKIVFDIDTKDVKTSTQDLLALNKVTESEVEALKRLESESNASKVAFQQLNKELKSANNELLNAKKQFGDTSKEAQSAQKNVDALTDKMAELKNTVKPLEDAFVGLRSQVKQAKEEAQRAAEKYGEFSTQANAARQRAGALADQMGDLNRQVNLLNPEAKAKAFSNLAQGVVGAFSIATGALQAFGIKNKEVEELAMKLQAALNITQGIASLTALKESYQDIKVVLGFTVAAQEAMTAANTAEAVSATGAAVATRSFTAALLTNPIFLAVAAIAALAGAMIALSDDTDTAKNSQIDFTEENEKLKKSLDASKESADATARAMIDLKVAKGEMSAADAAIAKNNMDLANSTEEVKKAITTSTGTIDAYRKSLIDAKKQYDKDIQEAEKDARLSGSVNADRILVQDKRIAKERYDLFVKNTKERIKKEQELLKANQGLLNSLTTETETKNTTVTTEEGNKRNDARKAEREKAAKEQQADFDKSMAEAEAEAAIEAQKIKERNDKRLALEKQLQDELNRARLLAVKGDKIAELQVQMDILDEQYAMDILNAERTGKDTSGIKAKYANDQTVINQQVTEAAVELGDKELKANKEKNDKLIKQDEEAAAERKAIIAGAFQLASIAGQTFFEGVTRQNDEELAILEDQKEKKIVNEKEYQRRLREIKNKQAEDAKKQAIYQASLDFSAALINALTFKPFEGVPAALIFASVVAAANLAKIIATPVPKFQKGTLAVPGVDMGRDSVHAMLQPGEAVIPVSTNRAYHPTIKAIYEKKISPSEINNFVMSSTSSGGKQSITANVDTYALGRALGKNKGVQIENANVVGRAMAKELLRGQNYRRA